MPKFDEISAFSSFSAFLVKIALPGPHTRTKSVKTDPFEVKKHRFGCHKTDYFIFIVGIRVHTRPRKKGQFWRFCSSHEAKIRQFWRKITNFSQNTGILAKTGKIGPKRVLWPLHRSLAQTSNGMEMDRKRISDPLPSCIFKRISDLPKPHKNKGKMGEFEAKIGQNTPIFRVILA